MTIVSRIEVPIPFPLKTVNCYYIQDSVPTLIDTGINSKEDLNLISGAIKEKGGSLSDLQRIVLTHGHTDHTGLAGRIEEIIGAKVYIHKWDRHKVFLYGEKNFEKRIERFHAFLTEAGLSEETVRQVLDTISRRLSRMVSPLEDIHLLSGGEQIDFDDFRLEVLHTPGHSSGAICLFNKENGDLFSGDSLLEKITPNPVVEIVSPEKNGVYLSIQHYKSTLELIKSLPVIQVLPGHGNSFTGHDTRADQIIAHHRQRKALVLKILKGYAVKDKKQQGMTGQMVAGYLFPSLEGMDIFLALSESIAHLQILEAEGAVFSDVIDGQRLYNLL